MDRCEANMLDIRSRGPVSLATEAEVARWTIPRQ